MDTIIMELQEMIMTNNIISDNKRLHNISGHLKTTVMNKKENTMRRLLLLVIMMVFMTSSAIAAEYASNNMAKLDVKNVITPGEAITVTVDLPDDVDPAQGKWIAFVYVGEDLETD